MVQPVINLRGRQFIDRLIDRWCALRVWIYIYHMKLSILMIDCMGLRRIGKIFNFIHNQIRYTRFLSLLLLYFL